MSEFKCIGLEESYMEFWNDKFTIGKNYYEHDYFAPNKCLSLISDDNTTYCVDASQFEEVL